MWISSLALRGGVSYGAVAVQLVRRPGSDIGELCDKLRAVIAKGRPLPDTGWASDRPWWLAWAAFAVSLKPRWFDAGVVAVTGSL